jgi:polyferredoxin
MSRAVTDKFKSLANSASRQKRPVTQTLRLVVQILFALLCIWIGVEFYQFVGYLDSSGTVTYTERPPGVDGFLPISSLMSLYYFILSGSIHPYHPAGLFILAAIVLVSLVFGKSFCSWLCPVGLISEMLGDLGDKLFGRRLSFPRWLDYPLRSIKYLLLAFFVYSIFFVMGEFALKQFLDSPYILLADVKMYYFFVEISRFALIVIGSLMLLSLVIRGFWCRYLCPYGALLGIVALLSPHKIKRNEVSCIDCGKCARACPARIKVDKVRTVVSDECVSCLSCIDSCPVQDTLELRSIVTKHKISPRVVAIGVIGLFVVVTGAAMITGQWRNNVPTDTYLRLHPDIHMMGHPTSTSELSELNKKK